MNKMAEATGAPLAQVFRSKTEIGMWLDQWLVTNLDNSECKKIFASRIQDVKKFNSEQLRKLVGEGKEKFMKIWDLSTFGATGAFASLLYGDLCREIGAVPGATHIEQQLVAEIAALRANALEREFVNDEGLPQITRSLGASTESSPHGSSRDLANQKLLPPIKSLVASAQQFGIYPKKFAVPEDSQREKPAPRASIRTYAPRELRWDGVASIAQLVRTVVLNAIDAGGLPFEILSEKSLISLRPNLWVVMNDNFPLCVIEVYIPSSVSLANGAFFVEGSTTSVYNQIANHILMLREAFGPKNVFGIVSTYQEWRFCWLGDDEWTNDLARATASLRSRTAPTMPAAPPAAPGPAAPVIASPAVSTTVAVAAHQHSLRPQNRAHTAASESADPSTRASAPPVPPAKAALRSRYIIPELILWGQSRKAQAPTDSATPLGSARPATSDPIVHLGLSQVFQFDDRELPLALVTLMHKLRSININETISDDFRSYVAYSNTSIDWCTLPQSHSRVLCFDQIHKVSQSDAILHLICGVGHGAEGRVVLFRDQDGYVYIGKFSNAKAMKEAMDVLSNEQRIWHRVHPELVDFVSLRNFGGRAPALIMPRFAHVPDDQHRDSHILDAVKEEIENFARQNLLHGDLHWRHVGLNRTGAALHAVFFDLGKVMEHNLQVEDAIRLMSDELLKQCRDGTCDGCKKARAM